MVQLCPKCKTDIGTGWHRCLPEDVVKAERDRIRAEVERQLSECKTKINKLPDFEGYERADCLAQIEAYQKILDYIDKDGTT